MTAYWSIADTVRHIVTGEVTATQLVEQTLARIEKVDGALGAFLTIDSAGALGQAAEIDRKRKAGEALGALAGVPVSLKDNLVTRGVATTAGSKILAGWVPPYDATVVDQAARRRRDHPRQDQPRRVRRWARRPSTPRSSRRSNPWDLDARPGRLARAAARPRSRRAWCAGGLGTDTGGSIRQPAAFCGVVGLKPTYGRVSRSGVVAFASSLDQVGPLTRTVERRRAAARGDRRPRSARLDLARPRRARLPRRPRPASVAGLRDRAAGGVLRRRHRPRRRAPRSSAAIAGSSSGRRDDRRRSRCRTPQHALAAYYLDRAGRGVVEPRALRRRALRHARRRRRDLLETLRARRAARASAPRSSGASCSAPTRCARATTTPTTEGAAGPHAHQARLRRGLRARST